MHYQESEIESYFQSNLNRMPTYIREAFESIYSKNLSENQKIKLIELLVLGIFKSFARFLTNEIKTSQIPFQSTNYESIINNNDRNVEDREWFLFLYDILKFNTLAIETSIKEQIKALTINHIHYEEGISESIVEPKKMPLSIIDAAYMLRNAIHHDNTKKISEKRLNEIRVYYLGIVVDILKNLPCLTLEKYNNYLIDNPVNLFRRSDEPLEIPDSWNYAHFESEENIIKEALKIKESYPWFISEYIDKVFDKESTWELRIYWLKCLFYDASKFLALVGLSCYFQNQNVKSKELDKRLTKLGIPDDATWRDLISEIVKAFEKSKEIPFVEDYIIQTKTTKNEECKNIPDGFSGFTNSRLLGLKTPTLLYAPAEIRNAVFHDENIPYEPDYERLFPLYAEVVIKLLLNYQFLSGARYKYVSYAGSNGFNILHGSIENHTHIKIQSFDEESLLPEEKNSLHILDTDTNSLLSLFPFTLKKDERWEEEREFILRRVYYKKAQISFSGRKSVYNNQNPTYHKFYEIVVSKYYETKFNDLNRKDLAFLKDTCIKTNAETLENYIGKKYQPGAYIERQAINNQITNFLEDKQKVGFFLTANSGMGKSAFLANLVYKNDTENNTDSNIFIFLNARELLTRINEYNPVFFLLKRHLVLKNDIENMVDFLKVVDNIWKKANSSVKICLVIDAINESYHPQEIFDEIDEMINSAYDFELGEPKYPWLKVIFTIRRESIYLLKDKRKEIRDNFFGKVIFTSEKPYFQADTRESEFQSKQNQFVLEKPKQKSAIIQIKPMNFIELQQVFDAYRDSFKWLSTNNFTIEAGSSAFLLGNPLFLLIYMRLADEYKGDKNKLPADKKSLFSNYYNLITRDNEVKEFLHFIAKNMVYDQQKAFVPVEELIDFLDKLNQDNELFYRSPLEKLVKWGLVETSLKEIEMQGKTPGNINYVESISIIQQYLAEYIIYQFIIGEYKDFSNEMLRTILNLEADFDELNNAISMVINDLWNQGRIDELARASSVSNGERYNRVFSNALYSEIVEKTAKPEYQIQAKELIEEFEKRLQLLLSDNENLRHIPDIQNIFLNRSIELKNRIGGFRFSQLSIDAAESIFNRLQIVDYEYGKCLAFKAQILREKGQLANSLIYYEKAIVTIDGLSTRGEEQKNYRFLLGILHTDAGMVYEDLENIESSVLQLEKAKQILTEFQDEDNIYFQRIKALNIYKSAKSEFNSGKFELALQTFSEAIKIYEKLTAKKPSKIDWQQLAIVYRYSGFSKMESGQYNEAEIFFQKDLDICMELHNEFPNDQLIMNNLSIAYEKKGDIKMSLGHLKQAQEFYHHKLKINEYLAEHVVEIEKSEYDLGIAYEKIGVTSLYLIEFEKALEYFENWQLICEKLIGINSLSFNNKKNLARAILFRGYALFMLKKEESITYLAKGEQLLVELAHHFPENIDIKESLLNAAMFLGAYYDWKNLLDKSVESYRKAYQLSKELFQLSPEKFNSRKRYAESLDFFIKRKMQAIETGKIGDEIVAFRKLIDECNDMFPNKLVFQKQLIQSLLYLATYNFYQEEKILATQNLLKAFDYCNDFILQNSQNCIEIIKSPLSIAELLHRIKIYKLAEMIFRKAYEILELNKHHGLGVEKFMQNIINFLNYYKQLNG